MPTPPQYIGYNVGRALEEPWRRHHVQSARACSFVKHCRGIRMAKTVGIFAADGYQMIAVTRGHIIHAQN